MIYSADFETTTDENDCRVWATGLCTVDKNLKFYWGNSIEWLFEFFRQSDKDTFYFHNLKFDGEFIIHYLLTNNYEHKLTRKEMTDKTFSTLISDANVFYCIEIKMDNGATVKILDSMKLLPMSVNGVAKGFGLPIEKEIINYTKKRLKGYIPTNEEVHYLKNDVEIIARALIILFEENITKMTIGSSALFNYKKDIGKKRFERMFPIPKYDADIRQCYKGGFTYCDLRTKGKDIDEGIVLDVNSLYPSVMFEKKLPYGEGIFFEGKYKVDKLYDLHIQMIRCMFKIKNKHIPTIQLKNNCAFIPTAYLEDSGDEIVTMCLTCVDLQLFFDHYEVYCLEYVNGWKFRSTDQLFKSYISKWVKTKIDAELKGNKALRQIAKLMLNSLYGKFALNPNVNSKIPYLKEGIVKYRLGVPEIRKPIYLPVATFVTSYAREKTIRSAQMVYDRFLYADTDSLHLKGWELPEGLEIHQTELGKWALESKFTRARFLRQKTYIEEIEGKLNITCSGMPDTCYKNVTWENFTEGNSFYGKLQRTKVVGGVVLKEEYYSIKKS